MVKKKYGSTWVKKEMKKWKVKQKAVHEALKQVMPQDMKGFFNYTGSSYILIWELLYSYFFH